MSSTARSHRRPADRKRATPGGRPSWVLPAVAALVIVIAGVVAVVLSGGGGPVAAPSTPASVAPPDPGAPVISGAPLPAFAAGGTDPAVGAGIPTVNGADFRGRAVSIAADGRPKVILFIAHWCPHCQREVPKIQDWLDSSGVPKGVDIVSVVTAIDPTLPNYPPEAWLTGAHWTPPVVVDATNTIARAYGLSAYPFFVFVDASGRVVGRTSGELEISTIQAAIRAIGGT